MNNRRFFISGSRNFNDYSFFKNSLKFVKDGDEIYLSGSENIQELILKFAEENGIDLLKRICFSKDVKQSINVFINSIESSDGCVFFWDGVSMGTLKHINIAVLKNKYTKIFYLNNGDLIKHNPKNVFEFSDNFSWLSNLFPSNIPYFNKDRIYNFYCAQSLQKALFFENDIDIFKKFENITGNNALTLFKKYNVKYDLELEKEFLKKSIFLKFINNNLLLNKLINETDNIINGGQYVDQLFGSRDGYGENILGNILMDIRDQLKQR